MRHTWYRPCDLDAESYREFVQDVCVLCSHLEARHRTTDNEGTQKLIAGPRGQGVPILNKDLIHFYIDACEFMLRRSSRSSYERFHPEINPLRWHECITGLPKESSPYDLLVCAILIAFQGHFPETVLDSEINPADWEPAVNWYCQCLPHRSIRPGPWSADMAHMNDVATLDNQAQLLGYHIVVNADVLILVYGNDYQNRQGKNAPFVNERRGRRDLASYLRLLANTEAIPDDQPTDC